MNHPMQSIVRDIISENFQSITISEVNIQSSHTGGYSCEVLCVCVKIRTSTGTDTLNLILKYLPEDSTETLKLSFRKEVLVYKLLIPEYRNVQKQLNIDAKSMLNAFPEFFGSNLDSDSSRCAFLMNDLKSIGYVIDECMSELDMERTKLVVDKLAYFHAMGIKLKEMNPNIFEDDFKEIVRPAFRNMNNPNKGKIDDEFIDKIKVILKHDSKLERFSESVVELIERINKSPVPDSREPFATVIHNDLWMNNILFKYDENDSPFDVKFIDFQFVIYNSPVRDLVYLIYTSTSDNVQSSYDVISGYYYDKFIEYLTLLKYSDLNLFNIDAYNNETKHFAWTKFKHVLMTILLVCDDNNRDEKLYKLFNCFQNNGWL